MSLLRAREAGILGALILIAIVLTIATPHFLTQTNLLNISRQMAIISIVAVGMTYLIISREFDLSVGSTFGLVGIVVGTARARWGHSVSGRPSRSCWFSARSSAW